MLDKITAEQLLESGVVSAPDKLVGKPRDNKLIFDRLVADVVVPAYNACVDAVNLINTREEEWTEREAGRVLAEEGRAAAEKGRVEAETARAKAEALRVIAENARAAAETARAETEELRVIAEESRASAEEKRAAAEQARVDETAGVVAQAGQKVLAAASEADRAKAEANRAQAEAERATVPAAAGVYNVILTDRKDGARYALIAEDGRMKLLGVSQKLNAAKVTLIEAATGTGYELAVESGKLILEEV